MFKDVNFKRAEFILTLLAVLGFSTLLIRITTISRDLPAHPLFVHVPVILIPVSVLGGLLTLARPRLLDSYGILLCAVAIVAMSSIFLAMQAGGALSGALHLTGRPAQLISEHSYAAKILAIVFTAFTALLILSFASHRISGGMPTGLAIADSVLGTRAIRVGLRVVLLVLALVAAFYVYRVGDLGAKAVWQEQLQTAHAAVPLPR